MVSGQASLDYGLEAVFATGKYHASTTAESVIANLGKNYNAIRPIFAYRSAPEYGLKVSSKISYSFNDQNDDTQYKSGQYFAKDYSTDYRLNHQFKMAIEGYEANNSRAFRWD